MPDLILAATGDSIITRRIAHLTDPDFTDLVALLHGAGAVFGNLELPLPADPVVPFVGKSLLCARPYVLDDLAGIGMNLFNLANNHAVDYTYTGLVDTMKALRQRGLAFAGAGDSLTAARQPAYLETAAGRVALVGAATPFATTTFGGWATDGNADCPGRPGINPLRTETRYVLDPARFRALADIDEALGTAAATRNQRDFGVFFDGKPGAVSFLGANFYQGDMPGTFITANAADLADIARWIGCARRQADVVVASLHTHEGPAGDRNCEDMAGFITTSARRFIDAGADVVLGHGPHLLRPMEMYHGKPIFYSLGNFCFMSETVERIPPDMYRGFGLGPDATPADLFDLRTGERADKPTGFHADRRYWQALAPVLRWSAGVLASVDLHPITLGLDLPRGQRGAPRLATPEEGADILERFAEMSRPFGAEIAVESASGRAVGRVRLE
jgi:poly-gamma-glutamate synthesis protein (capsule biosynthesis protein)